MKSYIYWSHILYSHRLYSHRLYSIYSTLIHTVLGIKSDRQFVWCIYEWLVLPGRTPDKVSLGMVVCVLSFTQILWLTIFMIKIFAPSFETAQASYFSFLCMQQKLFFFFFVMNVGNSFNGCYFLLTDFSWNF